MYVDDDTVDEDDEVTLYFTVKNEGGEDTGRWEYEVTLPTNPRETYTDRESSLSPGQSRTFRIEFDGLREGNNQDIDLELDPDDDVDEENERNNEETVEIDVRGDNNYNYNDDADLVITDMYVDDDTVDEDDEVTLYFTVKNEGGEDTGRWEYEVTLPTNPRETYTDRESSLSPGQSRTFRIEFDGLREGNNQDIDLELDPDDDVDEENERNNEETVEIDVRG